MISIVNNKIILITGADGGIGLALLKEAIQRGVQKIYASGVDMNKLKEIEKQYPQIVYPIELDITNEDSIKLCTLKCDDVNILINNAGVVSKSNFIGKSAAQKALFEMSVNYIGAISLINEFLPILKKNTPASIMHILSMASNVVYIPLASYCASKTAAHLMIQTMKKELQKYDIRVVGVYPGYVDTSMSKEVKNIQKITPNQLAINVFNDFENHIDHIFPDDMSKKFYTQYPISVTFLEL